MSKHSEAQIAVLKQVAAGRKVARECSVFKAHDLCMEANYGGPEVNEAQRIQ
jgi:hypothetical protein